MALIVEDGSVVQGANTYVDVEYVDEYCTLMNYTEWISAPDTPEETIKKESAIIRTMQFFENQIYSGYKTSDDNPLEWPRYGIYLDTGSEFPNNKIPEDLKKAVSEGAYIEYKTPDSLFESGGSTGKVKRKRIDVLETEYFESYLSVPFPKLKQMIRKYINSAGYTAIRS